MYQWITSKMLFNWFLKYFYVIKKIYGQRIGVRFWFFLSYLITTVTEKWKLWLANLPKAYRTSLSGPEIRQIFKVRTHQKPDVFPTGRRTFITWKNGEKNPQKKSPPKNLKILFSKFFSRFFFLYSFGLRTFDTKFVFRNLILWEVITCNW